MCTIIVLIRFNIANYNNYIDNIIYHSLRDFVFYLCNLSYELQIRILVI